MRLNSKIRRHSGRITPNLIKPKMKWNDIKEQALEPMDEWSDWIDYRDGFRDKINKEINDREKKK